MGACQKMKETEFMKAMENYLREVYLEKTPDLPAGVHSDLHAHPNIHDEDSLEHTLKVMHENGLNLLSIATHGTGDNAEFDYWKVKDMIKGSDAEEKYRMKEKGRTFSLTYKGKEFHFIPAYEMYVYVPGVNGRVDIVSVMPEQGFEKTIEKGLQFDEYKKINDDYQAIVIGAHPFTLWDPFLFGAIPFRLADKDERKNMKDNFFPQVDSVDMVATNALWMTRSNELVQEYYPGKPLTNSDVHSKCRFARTQLGISRNIFPDLDFETDSRLYEELLRNIKKGNFQNHLKHLSPMQFTVSFCMGKNPVGFP